MRGKRSTRKLSRVGAGWRRGNCTHEGRGAVLSLEVGMVMVRTIADLGCWLAGEWVKTSRRLGAEPA